MLPDGVEGAASFSDDGLHRFWLRRTWDRERKPVAFVGLNPSSAGADEDDPTIRRCARFARDWGFGGLLMVNLFSVIATDPKDLVGHPDRVREELFPAVIDVRRASGLVVAAWGAHPAAVDRAAEFVESGILGSFAVLGLTKAGRPRHPLYLRASCVPLNPLTLQRVGLPAATPEGGEDRG